MVTIIKNVALMGCPAGSDAFSGPRNGQGDLGDASSATPVAKKIEATVGYMEDHLDQPLQVSHLAALANVSPSHYFALFKRQTGWSPMHFFTRLRMCRARRLLEGTSMSVKEVAAALGFDDPFYFSRVFKSFHDVAPTEYRLLSSASVNAARSTTLSQSAARAMASGRSRPACNLADVSVFETAEC